ncbi:MAG: thiamine phosphate synthase [Bacteroides sp.]|nr:thiamine phosphate synthase [Bacteroides sp.]
MPALQFITHASATLSLVESARKALSLGIRWIQFRCKEELPPEQLRQTARQVQELCREHGALFVIDDRVELAADLQADGVHLGKHDMPIRQAREILGEGFIIGGTANTLQDMKDIAAQGGDYIGLGPFRFTATKERLSPLLGLDGYRNLMAEARSAGISLPVYAIGGIRSGDAAGLKACGVDGLAVSSALLSTEEPEGEAAAFLRCFGA